VYGSSSAGVLSRRNVLRLGKQHWRWQDFARRKLKIRLCQNKAGEIRLCQNKAGEIRLCQNNAGEIRLRQNKAGETQYDKSRQLQAEIVFRSMHSAGQTSETHQRREVQPDYRLRHPWRKERLAKRLLYQSLSLPFTTNCRTQ
jgi:hypothetical protein